jgi:glycogen debranching enzyme
MPRTSPSKSSFVAWAAFALLRAHYQKVMSQTSAKENYYEDSIFQPKKEKVLKISP